MILVLSRDGTPQDSGSFAAVSKSDAYVQTLQASAIEEPTERRVEKRQSGGAEVAPKNTPMPRPADQDKRRQLGDTTVYRYYFGSIGIPFVLTLLVLEVVWAFLQSFPCKFYAVISLLRY